MEQAYIENALQVGFRGWEVEVVPSVEIDKDLSSGDHCVVKLEQALDKLSASAMLTS